MSADKLEVNVCRENASDFMCPYRARRGMGRRLNNRVSIPVKYQENHFFRLAFGRSETLPFDLTAWMWLLIIVFARMANKEQGIVNSIRGAFPGENRCFKRVGRSEFQASLHRNPPRDLEDLAEKPRPSRNRSFKLDRYPKPGFIWSAKQLANKRARNEGEIPN
jgi:hypothetical protein